MKPFFPKLQYDSHMAGIAVYSRPSLTRRVPSDDEALELHAQGERQYPVGFRLGAYAYEIGEYREDGAWVAKSEILRQFSRG